MKDTDQDDTRNPDRGIGAGKAAITDKQRDGGKDAPHMPRHWQASGARGEAPGQPSPGPDEREIARGNQHGRAGRIASEQIHGELTEHGQRPAPQRRDNRQLGRRPGEREGDLPTP